MNNLNEVVISVTSLSFMCGMFTGWISGMALGYLIYLHKGETDED